MTALRMTHVRQRNGRNEVRLGLKQLIGKQRDATPFLVGVEEKARDRSSVWYVFLLQLDEADGTLGCRPGHRRAGCVETMG